MIVLALHNTITLIITHLLFQPLLIYKSTNQLNQLIQVRSHLVNQLDNRHSSLLVSPAHSRQVSPQRFPPDSPLVNLRARLLVSLLVNPVVNRRGSLQDSLLVNPLVNHP